MQFKSSEGNGDRPSVKRTHFNNLGLFSEFRCLSFVSCWDRFKYLNLYISHFLLKFILANEQMSKLGRNIILCKYRDALCLLPNFNLDFHIKWYFWITLAAGSQYPFIMIFVIVYVGCGRVQYFYSVYFPTFTSERINLRR